MKFQLKVLTYLPVSGTTSEYHFGKTSTNSLWIEFEDSEFNNWIGSFGNGRLKNEKIFKLSDFEYFILANGTAYIIDCLKKENLFQTEYEFIEDFIVIKNKPETQILISDLGRLKIINLKNEIIKVLKVNPIESVNFYEKNGNIITGEFEAYWTDWKRTKFELDIETGEFKTIK